MLSVRNNSQYVNNTLSTKVRKNFQTMKKVDRWDLPSNAWNNLELLSPEIPLQFKFAMALTNYALDSGHTTAKMTGSLLACAYGGGRIPKDIDIDMQADQIQSFRSNLINKVRYISVENDLFQIVKAKSSKGCVAFTFKHTTTPNIVDPFDLICDEDGFLNEIEKKFKTEQEFEISLDMNPPNTFTDVKMEEQLGAHVGPGFMIASYLARMDKEKKDSEQIVCLISYLRNSGYSTVQIFNQVNECLNQGSEKYSKMIIDLLKILT